ncbi:MAG: GTPase HflX [Patescibacteria group bacterium]|nr:GTPase HflX [Patescibacteria group bacterium]
MDQPRVILIDVISSQTKPEEAKRRLLELESLTHTYGGMIVVKIIQKRVTPDYKTYIGPGKLEEVIAIAEQEQVEIIIINNLLKPHQIFNIERMVERKGIKVWDRIDLILKIFQKHADTTEAKLQIRLAGIRHMGPRIYRMGLELSQQAGGIGTRGSGETNIEQMKRHLAVEERAIKKQISKYANTRSLHRARRDKMGFKTVSIVGYTNAGKSSLLNALTKKGAYVADELFATLDTRVAKLWLPSNDPLVKGGHPAKGGIGGLSVLLSDTIGFIQDLPPQLIQAFRSTLEETVHADLILHVIDVSDQYMDEKINEVEEVLAELEVTDTKKIYVFNKIDNLKRVPRTAIKKKYKAFKPVFVSCKKSEGLEELKKQIADSL